MIAIKLTSAELLMRAAEYRALARMAPTPEAQWELTRISARYEKLVLLRAATFDGDLDDDRIPEQYGSTMASVHRGGLVHALLRRRSRRHAVLPIEFGVCFEQLARGTAAAALLPAPGGQGSSCVR
jgi:hypothetical protein